MKNSNKLFLFAILLLAGCTNTPKPVTTDTLADAVFGFENVQDSARTKTWWFHGETETTKEGITADLEAFKRAGIGGVVYYDQTHGPMDNALPAFSPEWWEMLRFSAKEAERLGLTFEVNVSNGFVAGGPWITYEHGMKYLAATERKLHGGQYFEGKLEVPANRYKYSQDVAVIAFPAPVGGGISSATEKVTYSSNTGGINLENLFNPKSSTVEQIPVPGEGKSVYINLQFEDEFTARSISYEVRPKGKATTSASNIPGPPQETFFGTGYRVLPKLGELEVSDDGVNYTPVCDLQPIYQALGGWRVKTLSFPAVTGKYFRLNLHDWWEKTDASPDMQLARVVLQSTAKLDQYEEKAGFYPEYIDSDHTPAYSAKESIDASRILNISDKMDAEGVLRWDVPEGDWIIMRFAYVPTGASIKHGRRNLMGRECDKLSVAAAELQWKNYVGPILDSLKVAGIHNLSGVVMDSHEAGSQNWTNNFIEEFTRRQGYDPTLYLPAMMGYIINDPQTSNDFLFDIRRNIADMVSDNYFGTFERLCNENGLTLTAQAIGNALCIPADPIQAKSKVTKPQGEFWPIHPDGMYDIKECSSSAHLYNKHTASAEAYTDAKYSHSAADLKTLADYAFAWGIKELVICASAYQPWQGRYPGNTGGGRHYCLNRNNTWWEYSAPFWDYQARIAYVMRQGKPSIDLCVYLGGNAPVKILTYKLPDIPGGYDFDAFTSDALLTRMSAKGSRIMLPDGTGYNMMILPRDGDITLEALRKIAGMVKQGIRIYGPKPTVHFESNREAGKKEEYTRLADELWGETPAAHGSNRVGKGLVYWGMPLSEAIGKAIVTPDIKMQTGNTKDNMIYFAHRKLVDADIYFMANRKDLAEETTFTFSAHGKSAQLWNPVTGKRYSLRMKESNDTGTSIDLYMAPREAFFVVFTDKQEELPAMEWYKPTNQAETITGAWDVYFDTAWGGPGNVVFDELCDWTTSADPRIKYYSGTAVYKKTIQIEPGDDRIYLDMGNPGLIARVFVNSQEAGVVWCSPWNLDITRYLTNGENNLEIHVANSLMNRMIYDVSLPEDKRITYAYPIIASKDSPLVPSGLKKVRIVRENHN